MKLPKINKIGNYSHSQILAISDEEDYIYVSNGNFEFGRELNYRLIQ